MSDIAEQGWIRLGKSRGQDGEVDRVPPGSAHAIMCASVRCDDCLGKEGELSLFAKLATGAEKTRPEAIMVTDVVQELPVDGGVAASDDGDVDASAVKDPIVDFEADLGRQFLQLIHSIDPKLSHSQIGHTSHISA